MMINKKKVLGDIVFNIAGSLILTATLQLIIYPLLSKNLGDFKFGSLLTIIGISNVLGSMIGVSLNNVRLLNDNFYKQNKNEDFLPLISRNSILITFAMGICLIILYKQVTIFESIIILLIPILTMMRSFMNIYYRIDLNFKLILLHMLITSVGYVVGLIIYRLISIWPLVFLSGETFALIFALKTTSFKNEKYKKSNNYNRIKKESNLLITSNLISNLLVYLDRIIINPFLGAANVSVYFIASLIGKTMGIVLQPISSIILTYISKFNEKRGNLVFIYLNGIIIISSVIAFFIGIPLSPIIIKILYPENFNNAVGYFNIANLGAILSIAGTLLQPVTLKYCPLWWQSAIQFIYIVIYLVLCIVLMKSKHLYGFCIANVISNIIRYLMIFFVGLYYTILKEK